ncbi:MAG: hypothetical protein ABH832_02435 [bacterium]
MINSTTSHKKKTLDIAIQASFIVIFFMTILLSQLEVCFAETVPAGKSAVASGCTTDDKTGKVTCKLENPLKVDTTDMPTLIGIAIKGVLGVIGAVALFVFFWGANSWLISVGNPEKIKAGTQTMMWAAVGLLLVFASYMMMRGVFSYVGG